MDVFINDVSAFLPNPPVTNDAIEDVLGKVRGNASKAKRLVLKSNQITQRYYALDPESGRLTHTNAQLTAEAVRRQLGLTKDSPRAISNASPAARRARTCCSPATP